MKEYTKGPRLLLNCRGSYICKNKNCKDIGDFGINQREFSYKNENLVCSICGVDASYIRCEDQLVTALKLLILLEITLCLKTNP